MVFSTLHTNDAPSTITRLRDMGLESYLITATWKPFWPSGWCAKICEDCRAEFEPSSEILMELSLRPEDVKGKKFYLRQGLRPLQQHWPSRPHGFARIGHYERRIARHDFGGWSTDH